MNAGYVRLLVQIRKCSNVKSIVRINSFVSTFFNLSILPPCGPQVVITTLVHQPSQEAEENKKAQHTRVTSLQQQFQNLLRLIGFCK